MIKPHISLATKEWEKNINALDKYCYRVR